MHSLNEASPQKIFGFAGDEFTFNNRNKIIKMIAKIARNVVDIFNHFHTVLQYTLFHSRLVIKDNFH